MRKTISLNTYLKIKNFFISNSKDEFAPTYIRDKLNLDYYSVKLVLSILLKEKFIRKRKEKYKLRC